MKINKILSIIAVFILCTSLFTGNVMALGVGHNTVSHVVYIPLWMQPNTIIVYDDNLNYTIIQGGELSDADLVGRTDIELLGLTTTDPGFLAKPNTKVEYDLHGFHQNTFYQVPGTLGEYRLSPPVLYRNGTGVLANGSNSGDYGQYTNYDTQTKQYNYLSRSGSTITGTGRITYYYGSTGDHSNTLKKYDCATKMYSCDVTSGTAVTAKNTYTNPNKSKTFYKQDCGSLPSAILDIWCGTSSSDTSNQAIKDITSGGGLDNVYSGYISLSV
jgi:hypothetical protein